MVSSESIESHSGSDRNPYSGVVLLLLAAALLGAAGALGIGLVIADSVLLDTALLLGLSASVLLRVAATQTAREKYGHKAATDSTQPSPDTGKTTALTPPNEPILLSIRQWLLNPDGMQDAAYFAARIGGVLCAVLLFSALPIVEPTTRKALIAAVFCLLGAGLSVVAARYLAGAESARFPEAAGLCRGARIVAWIMIIAAVSVGLWWTGHRSILGVLHILVLAANAGVCYSLLAIKSPKEGTAESFSLDLPVLLILGSRPNILASILDAAERQLGIDLRSTWALTVVRRSLEPLIIGLCFMGWLSTSLTVVGAAEQGLVERLGVPVAAPPFMPGLHVHWPWPIDRVYRIPMQSVQSFDVGHAGAEGGGPENVLWAVEHAPNEYSLLLGNGRDLVTMDASVQFRVVDAQAWRYHCRNPAEALSAIAYRAVMRSTVNRTLSEVLSENRATFTGQMLDMVQKDADAMDLGVKIVGFMVGAMHPPVPVAQEYEAVVSAEVGKVTATVNAQTTRNQLVPVAEAAVVDSTNTARAEGAEERARAAGAAWSFRTLEAQYRVAPQEYFFRRRLETLEKGLAGRRFTVVDHRFERDGGELWLTQ